MKFARTDSNGSHRGSPDIKSLPSIQRITSSRVKLSAGDPRQPINFRKAVRVQEFRHAAELQWKLDVFRMIKLGRFHQP